MSNASRPLTFPDCQASERQTEQPHMIRKPGLFGAVAAIGLLTMLLGILCVPVASHADDEEVWPEEPDHVEYILDPVSEVVGGYTLEYGQQRTIQAMPMLVSYDVFVSNQGNNRWVFKGSVPASNPTVVFTMLDNNGQITPISSTAAVFTFLADTQSTVRMDVTAAGMSSYAQPCFSYGVGETWTVDHSETSLLVTLTAPDGAHGVEENGTRSVNAHAERQTWDVLVSSLGNTMTGNFQTSPAAGAAATWSAQNGSVNALTTLMDENGDATVSFTMGADSYGVIQVTAAHSTTSTATASLLFTQTTEENWVLDHTEGYLSAAMNANGGQELVPGSSSLITTSVTYTSWEVWTSDWGNTEQRNESSSPATGAVVNYSIPQGDGIAADATGITDSNGIASTTFLMGNSASSLRADVSFAGAMSIYGTLDFTVPAGEWAFDHMEEFLNVSMNSWTFLNEMSVAAGASYTTREVWRFSTTGETETRNESTVPITGGNVTWTIALGDAFIAAADGSIYGGGARATIDLGPSSSSLCVTVNIPSMVPGNEVVGSAELPLPAGNFSTGDGGTGGDGSTGGTGDSGNTGAGDTSGENWIYDHLDGYISVGISDQENTGNNVDTLHAVATATTWEVWRNTADDSTQNRNPGTFPASNADITWVGGNSFQTNADELGRAQMDVSRGSETNTFSVTASIIAWNRVPESGVQLYPPIISGSGSISVGPASWTGGGDPGNGKGGGNTGDGGGGVINTDPWSEWMPKGKLNIALADTSDPEQPISTISATATYDIWEERTNSQTNDVEKRNEASGPITAPIAWTITEGDASVDSEHTNFATDTSGAAAAVVLRGTVDSTLKAEVSFAGRTESATTPIALFTPPDDNPPDNEPEDEEEEEQQNQQQNNTAPSPDGGSQEPDAVDGYKIEFTDPAVSHNDHSTMTNLGGQSKWHYEFSGKLSIKEIKKEELESGPKKIGTVYAWVTNDAKAAALTANNSTKAQWKSDVRINLHGELTLTVPINPGPSNRHGIVKAKITLASSGEHTSNLSISATFTSEATLTQMVTTIIPPEIRGAPFPVSDVHPAGAAALFDVTPIKIKK